MSDLLAARVMMALSLGFHIVFACIGIGLPLLLLAAEGMYLRTGDRGWRELAVRWSKGFAVLFAVGAVSGTVLSFELGLLWPEFMGRWSAVFGFAFGLEGFAFFLEAIFVGIYLYGWDRLSPRAHWVMALPIALAGATSAFFVMTVNAWMQAPVGFDLVDGELAAVRPLEAMLNPATPALTAHMLLAAYLVTGLGIAAIYAVQRLRGRDRPYERRAFGLGLALALPLAPLQVVAGDWAARVVADTQPAKLAAMKAQFVTERAAPMRLGGWVDEEERRVRYALEVPGLLSLMAHGDLDAEVRGLDRIAPAERPPLQLTYQSFQVMVACGLYLLALAGWAGVVLVRKRRLPAGRGFLWAVAAAAPLAVVALEAGWVVTEVGRQPWVVYGFMTTAEAVTTSPGVHWALAFSLATYGLLTAALVGILIGLARRPLSEPSSLGRAAASDAQVPALAQEESRGA